MLTKTAETVIIHKHLRECWNGRQARLRCVWLRRVGSSPISRTKISATPYGVADIFMLEMGLERPLNTRAGGTFLGRGRVPQHPDASGTAVDGF